MPSPKQSEVQRLHRSVSERETRYLQVVNDRLPSGIANLIENNFFTSTALYTFLLLLSFVLSVFSKTAETDVVAEYKQLASQAKQDFSEEKEELNKHFSKVLEETKAKAAEQLEQAQGLVKSSSSELQAKIAQAKADTEAKVQELEKEIVRLKADSESKVQDSEKEIVRLKDDLLNSKDEHEKYIKTAKKFVDDSHVQISDLHYQIAEKDKKIHALESVEAHLNQELAKEKEMHETSKEALHDAVDKLIHAKQQFTNNTSKKAVA